MDKSFHPISVDAYTKMIDLFRSTRIKFEYSVLTTATLSALKCACDKREIQLNRIAIVNSTAPLEAFAELASVIGVTKCSEVNLRRVDLNANKLSRFRLRCIEDKVELQSLYLKDKGLNEEGFCELAAVLQVTRSKQLTLNGCDLNEKKLSSFWKECQKSNVQLQSLYLKDKGLNEEGFCELAAVLQVTRSEELTLDGCDLNEKKLSSFWKECQKSNVQLDTLRLRDKNMNGEGYSELASVLEVTRCQELAFHQCDLNDEKLCQFWKQCKSLNVRVGKINIHDSAMQPAGYNEFAMVTYVTKCKNIFFGDCDLDKEKLLGFRQRCQKEKLLLDTLRLRDKNMNGEGYSELASVLEVTSCQELVLDECDLNDEKLCQFWKQCKLLNVRIQELDIRQQGYVVTDEVITQICELMEYVVTHISISGWVMNEQHKTRLKSTLDLPSSKAKILNLSDEQICSNCTESVGNDRGRKMSK